MGAAFFFGVCVCVFNCRIIKWDCFCMCVIFCCSIFFWFLDGLIATWAICTVERKKKERGRNLIHVGQRGFDPLRSEPPLLLREGLERGRDGVFGVLGVFGSEGVCVCFGGFFEGGQDTCFFENPWLVSSLEERGGRWWWWWWCVETL